MFLLSIFATNDKQVSGVVKIEGLVDDGFFREAKSTHRPKQLGYVAFCKFGIMRGDIPPVEIHSQCRSSNETYNFWDNLACRLS